MVIPIHDLNPLRRTPWVTYTLIAINVVALLLTPASPTTVAGSPGPAALCQQAAFYEHYAAIPRELVRDQPLRLVPTGRVAVGPRWGDAVHFWCEAPRANRPDDPPIPPTRIFDNVFAIGNSGTTVYLIRTSSGLLMIDALGGNDAQSTSAQVESQLLPGFEKLGLDPAQVKVILVTHGHADHFGGSSYFQERYGSKVYISAADWNLMENPPARGRGGRGPANASSKTRHGDSGRPDAYGGRFQRQRGRRAWAYARIDGLYLSRERPWESTRRRAVRGRVAYAADSQRRGARYL